MLMVNRSIIVSKTKFSNKFVCTEATVRICSSKQVFLKFHSKTPLLEFLGVSNTSVLL